MAVQGLSGRWGRVGLVNAVALAALGCGAPSSSESANEPKVAIDGVIVCRRSQTLPTGEVKPAEWYSLFAMNNKLKHYPEFAATTGMDSVSNCGEARRWYDDYLAYEAAHPDFDDNEPIEDYPLTPVPAPSQERATVVEVGEISKIQNGVNDFLKPVVFLDNNSNATHDNGGLCTGWFIAKNFVATAAHCLKAKDGFLAGVQDEQFAELETWYPYTISTPTSGGAIATTTSYKNVLQYYDHRYPGFRDPDDSVKYDFALLFVYYGDDASLPNNVPAQTGPNVPYLRVSLRNGLQSSSPTTWGWGPPNTGTRLRRADLSGYNVLPHETTADGPHYLGIVPSPANSPVPCEGDSGGPLVDQFNITASNGTSSQEFVGAGVISNINTQTECAQPGGSVFWMRTDAEKQNIRAWVGAWYPQFHCNLKQSDSSPSQDYMECWGQPCNSTATNDVGCPPGMTCCDAGQTCLHPGEQLTGCTQCGSSGDCSCIYGQCFAEPVEVPSTPPYLPPLMGSGGTGP